jgi:hypothetical protein
MGPAGVEGSDLFVHRMCAILMVHIIPHLLHVTICSSYGKLGFIGLEKVCRGPTLDPLYLVDQFSGHN